MKGLIERLKEKAICVKSVTGENLTVVSTHRIEPIIQETKAEMLGRLGEVDVFSHPLKLFREFEQIIRDCMGGE